MQIGGRGERHRERHVDGARHDAAARSIGLAEQHLELLRRLVGRLCLFAMKRQRNDKSSEMRNRTLLCTGVEPMPTGSTMLLTSDLL